MCVSPSTYTHCFVVRGSHTQRDTIFLIIPTKKEEAKESDNIILTGKMMTFDLDRQAADAGFATLRSIKAEIVEQIMRV